MSVHGSRLTSLAKRLRAEPEPEPVVEEPVTEREDEEWLLLAKQWLDLDEEIKALENRRSETASQIAALSPDTPGRGGGIVLMRYWMRGRVDVVALAKAFRIPEEVIEKYRSAARRIVSVRRASGHN